MLLVKISLRGMWKPLLVKELPSPGLSVSGGNDVPALLFTASHGMGFPNGNPSQLQSQGALLWQDWPGPQAWHKAVPSDFYLSAADISGDAKLSGLIAIHFACYGLGTPQLDDYSRQASGPPQQIAPRALSLACRNVCWRSARVELWRSWVTWTAP